MTDRPTIDRRRFLSGAAAATAAVAGGGMLAGCGGGGSKNTNSSDANLGVKLPTYVPGSGPKTDMPGNSEGLLDAFSSYPDPPAKMFSSPPMKGGTVSAFVLTGSPV